MFIWLTIALSGLLSGIMGNDLLIHVIVNSSFMATLKVKPTINLIYWLLILLSDIIDQNIFLDKISELGDEGTVIEWFYLYLDT